MRRTFVDMVRDTIVSKLNEHEVNEQEYRIYTTLDPDLQRAAAQAVETGIKLVDDQVTKMRTKRTRSRRASMKRPSLPARRRRWRSSPWTLTPAKSRRWSADETTEPAS